MSLADVLAPAIEMADGYPIESELADVIEREKARDQAVAVLGGASSCRTWARRARRRSRARSSASPTSPRRCASWSRPSRARSAGKTRKEAIYAAYDRFYKGDIARRSSAARRSKAGSSRWRTSRSGGRIEEPVSTTYRGIAVYKLDVWTQGPAMLQALNILETMDLKGDGLQQRALPPRDLPGDEPRVRRPRLLLRRSGRPPAEPRSGCCRRSTPTRAARRSTGRRTTRSRSPAIRIRSRADESVPRPARAVEGDAPVPKLSEVAHLRRGLSRWHDLDRGRRREGLGRLGDAERRLGAGV